jgi:hypothetical protein
MKNYWIKRGAPVMAMLFLVAFGVMSCSNDPMSAPDNGSSAVTLEATGSTPNEASTMEIPDIYRFQGHLRIDPTNTCWFLVIRPGLLYELRVGDRLRGEDNGRNVIIEGTLPQNMQPRCSNWAIFKADKIRFLD